jgi:ketosteroid isomerase-like protein
MLRYMTAVVVAFAQVASAHAQNRAAPHAPATAQTFVDLESAWNDALVMKDVASLGVLLADDYVSTDELGQLRDKAATLARIRSGQRNFQSMRLSDVRVHTYGDAAIVTGINTVTGTMDGRPTPPRVAFTDMFVRQNGTWRAVATHTSEVR